MPIEITVALALARLEVAHIAGRTDRVAFACLAVGEAVVSVGANFAEIAAEIFLAWAPTVVRFAVVTLGSV